MTQVNNFKFFKGNTMDMMSPATPPATGAPQGAPAPDDMSQGVVYEITAKPDGTYTLKMEPLQEEAAEEQGEDGSGEDESGQSYNSPVEVIKALIQMMQQNGATAGEDQMQAGYQAQ